MRTVPTSTDQIRAFVAERVGWIVLDRQDKHNALSGAMFRALAETAASFDADPEVRVVVVRGAGERAFASGADIGELSSSGGGGGSAAATTLATGKPVIAMISGYCIGGGLMLALEADLRIATADAQFGIPAGRLGAGYPLESVRRLVALVGTSKASQILLVAGRFDASTALAMGLVDEVVSHGELEPRVNALAAQIADNAPLSLAASKAAIAVASGLGSATISDVQDLIRACWTSEDFAEGRAAFAEKRPPRFTGR